MVSDLAGVGGVDTTVAAVTVLMSGLSVASDDVGDDDVDDDEVEDDEDDDEDSEEGGDGEGRSLLLPVVLATGMVFTPTPEVEPEDFKLFPDTSAALTVVNAIVGVEEETVEFGVEGALTGGARIFKVVLGDNNAGGDAWFISSTDFLNSCSIFCGDDADDFDDDFDDVEDFLTSLSVSSCETSLISESSWIDSESSSSLKSASFFN